MKNFLFIIKSSLNNWKFNFFKVNVLSILSAIFETIGIGVFIPLLLILADENLIRNNIYLKEYINIYLPTSESLIIFFYL